MNTKGFKVKTTRSQRCVAQVPIKDGLPGTYRVLPALNLRLCHGAFVDALKQRDGFVSRKPEAVLSRISSPASRD